MPLRRLTARRIRSVGRMRAGSLRPDPCPWPTWDAWLEEVAAAWMLEDER